jgi:putative aminopeptidase FrvX
MYKNEILKVLKKLAAKRAPSGLEKARGEIFRQELERCLQNKNIPVNIDTLGNVYVKFEGLSPKKAIAVYAHIDEIGGTIRNINNNGMLEFSKRGGYEGRWLLSREIQILNRESKWIKGVIEGRSVHSVPQDLRNKEKIEAHEQKIYIGARNADEVKNLYKIHIGAPFVFSGSFGLLNPEIDDDIIAGYSLDNLVAVTCLILLTEKIANNLLNEEGKFQKDYNLNIVSTTREEIGTEGALFFSRNNKIDHVIAIDIGIVADFTGRVNSDIKLREGPVITWQELNGTGVFDFESCKKLALIAEKNNIPYQDGIFEYYGSDAGKTQKWLGIPSILVGIPTMYSHNVPEISTLSGIEKAANLVYQYLCEL